LISGRYSPFHREARIAAPCVVVSSPSLDETLEGVESPSASPPSESAGMKGFMADFWASARRVPTELNGPTEEVVARFMIAT